MLFDLRATWRLVRAPTDEAVAPLQLKHIPVVARRAPDDPGVIAVASGRAPFDGTAEVAQAFTTPSGPSPAPVVSDQPRLIGTVVQGEGTGFVMMELPDARVLLVRIGERVGNLRLRSVAAGLAVFEDARGEKVSLRSPQAGAGTHQ